jgi:hypothetical protein
MPLGLASKNVTFYLIPSKYAIKATHLVVAIESAAIRRRGKIPLSRRGIKAKMG